MAVTVANLRAFRVGRRIILPPDVARIDRRTPYGNPFVIGQPIMTSDDETNIQAYAQVPASGWLTRQGALAYFAGWLDERLVEDPTFLDPLCGRRLACWCVREERPARPADPECHGDIIAGRLLDRCGNILTSMVR